jgi:hypothetical protein
MTEIAALGVPIYNHHHGVFALLGKEQKAKLAHYDGED